MNTNICDGWEVWCVMRNGIVRAGERGDNGRVMSDQKTGSDTCSQTRLSRAMSKRRNSNWKGMSAGRYIYLSVFSGWLLTDSALHCHIHQNADLRQWWWLCYPLLTNDADTKYTQVFTQVHSPCILREGNKSHANILPLCLLVIHITVVIILLFPIQEKNSGTPIGNI